MSKRIAEIERRPMGHLYLVFNDGSTAMVFRGGHERHELKVGDFWPPAEEGNENALDPQTSEETSQQGQPADFGTATENESGAAQQSGDGPCEEGQLATEEEASHEGADSQS